MHPTRSGPSLPLWPLPLLCAALPFAAAHLGWWLSTAQELVPSCNPYLEGCVSISHASRHGLGNLLFRLLVLPAATLQALCWLAVAAWLRRERPVTAWLPWLGCVAALALAVYATFLGSEGHTYELMRRHGIYLYFGCSYLSLLLCLRALAPSARAHRPLLWVAIGMLGFGLASLAASCTLADTQLRHRAENVLEWHVGLWLTAIFAVLAWAWWREKLRIGLG